MQNTPIATPPTDDERADGHDPAGTDELNFAEFPLSIMGKRPEGVKTLEFCDTVFDTGAGKEVTRKLTVTGSDLYGLPGEADEDVLVVLMALTAAADFNSPTVHFSRYRLIELLGWSQGGKSYARLEESLNRWLGVTLYYEKAWWDKKHKKWVNQNFHILSSLSLYDRRNRGGQDELPLSSFTWNENIFDSFLARNTKALDLNDYFRLTLAPAKRMYRFLDKRFGAKRGHVWRFDLREFAEEHIGFSRGYDSAQLKRKMQPSIEELEEHGFLKPMDERQRYPIGVKRGEHFIVVEKATSAPPAATAAPIPAPLETELAARGVTATVAAELAARFPAEHIRGKIDVLAWLIDTGDARVAKNPAGYLVKSIRDDYAPPPGFVSKAERERQEQAAADTNCRRHEAENASRRQEEGEHAARRRERGHIERYLATLSTAHLAALKERALAAATDDERQTLSSPFADTVRGILIDRQVLHECPLP